jgi:uncharacterized protein
MNIAEKHQQLYDRIPKFECKKNCTDCCGPVPFSKWEWSRVKDKRKGTGLTCPYAVNGRCEIYDKRPLICRLFGTVEDLRCPHGQRPKKLLTKEEAYEILIEYSELIDK